MMKAIHLPHSAKDGAHFLFCRLLGPILLILFTFTYAQVTTLAQTPNSGVMGQNPKVETEAFQIRAYGQFELVKLFIKNDEVV